jgi:hypothetical protein
MQVVRGSVLPDASHLVVVVAEVVMSRHVFESDGREVVVGWDMPLMTYYLQIHLPNVDEDENPVVWYGTNPSELYTLTDLEGCLHLHSIKVPKGLEQVLYRDRDEGR